MYAALGTLRTLRTHLTKAFEEVKMAATMENGGISLILLNCDGEPISSGDDNAQRIVVG